MRSACIVASVIFLAFALPAYSQVDEPGKTPATPSRGTSLGTDIKNAARGIGHGIRTGARQFKAGVKDGALQFKRSIAVARCNNGEYSYTHHKTCNHNGGVREQLR
ncbi:MAG TPA: hypothetical protein VKF40_15375 [Burkholderiales bacterium]|nr:hypothetical protein [Burkholderiales bacterium]